MYEYTAKYISNYDGDTIKFMADLGFGIFHKITVRLEGVDTPEIRNSDPTEKLRAYEARDFVREALSGADKIIICTKKDKKGKYGRYIAEIIYDGSYLTSELIDRELAVNKEY